MKFKYLKFDFLKNEKRFWSEIKYFFQVSQVLSFGLEKQTSTNVVDTTFEWEIMGLQPLEPEKALINNKNWLFEFQKVWNRIDSKWTPHLHPHKCQL